ncbi:transporter substrate-binding domain-containing protein [Pseudomonas sp. B21-036]|uniref:transporter substrate-binding domain-containing protein n=1 Tax=Pseudomonas TaxID=286 RepID=UPI000E25276C|nr:transporter substrate-binding domain-containing protein [Pseudomonas sp. B21-036]UVL53361.1 transporter substrate-binding domain-containing protein [Pseudomonas sp. B21-036]
MKKTLVAVVHSLLLAGAINVAHAQDKVVFAISQEPYPPFSFRNSNGAWSGFEPDLISEVCKRMQAECSLKGMAWDGLIPALRSKQVDVIMNSMSITPEREQVVDFSDPYIETPALWVGDAALELTPTPEGLKGKIIGVQGSTSHSAYVKEYFGKGSTLRYYNDQDDLLADLRSGRIDIMLADKISVEPMLALPDNAMLAGKGIAPADPLFGKGIGAAVRKGDDALREKLNQALKAVREDGTYDAIGARYFKSSVTAAQ